MGQEALNQHTGTNVDLRAHQHKCLGFSLAATEVAPESAEAAPPVGNPLIVRFSHVLSKPSWLLTLSSRLPKVIASDVSSHLDSCLPRKHRADMDGEVTSRGGHLSSLQGSQIYL